ncbi:MAG: hypothetical protein M1833_006063 [Piccolia ochrophora]|nr:MAG: hypothetical protein M1833_006063 [Piccolia ochrophora]
MESPPSWSGEADPHLILATRVGHTTEHHARYLRAMAEQNAALQAQIFAFQQTNTDQRFVEADRFRYSGGPRPDEATMEQLRAVINLHNARDTWLKTGDQGNESHRQCAERLTQAVTEAWDALDAFASKRRAVPQGYITGGPGQATDFLRAPQSFGYGATSG